MARIMRTSVLLCLAGLAGAAEVDSYLTGIAREYWTARAREVSRLRTPEEIRERQGRVRAKFIELLGGFPQKTPLNARITGTLARGAYRIEKLVFESMPRFYVTANVYVPERGAGPFPAVLGTAGHSESGKAQWNYQRAWIEMARRGFVVLALDPPGQGERVQYWDTDLGRSRIGAGTPEHTLAGLQCILTGTNVARYFMWDDIRAVDYLVTRKDVDATRIAVAGNSGGGMQSAYLAMLEPRLAAAAPSCYMTSSEALWSDPGPQDAEQTVAGFLASGLGLADFALAFAPRPFLFLTATRDFFPIAGARATFEETRRVYELLGARDRVDFFEHDDIHGWWTPRREATYRWFERWLNHREDSGREGEFDIEPDSALWCTPTGQVATSFGGETVHSLNLALAERLARERKKLTPERLRSAVRERLGSKPLDGGALPPLKVLGATEGPARKPAVLYLNEDGGAGHADAAALARAGNIVGVPVLRGWGAGREEAGPHGGEYRTAMRALLVGRSMLGLQVADVLASYRALAARPDVAARIGIFGKGNGGVVGLFAAAIEPGIRKLVCEGSLISYMAMARAQYHEGLVQMVLPGVLKDFDLPELAAAVAPRAVWIVNPARPSGARESIAAARREYAEARVVERPEGWSFEKTYAGWLAQ